MSRHYNNFVDRYNEILDRYNGFENKSTSVDNRVLADIDFSLRTIHGCPVIWADPLILENL